MIGPFWLLINRQVQIRQSRETSKSANCLRYLADRVHYVRNILEVLRDRKADFVPSQTLVIGAYVGQISFG